MPSGTGQPMNGAGVGRSARRRSVPGGRGARWTRRALFGVLDDLKLPAATPPTDAEREPSIPPGRDDNDRTSGLAGMRSPAALFWQSDRRDRVAIAGGGGGIGGVDAPGTVAHCATNYRRSEAGPG